MSVEIQTKFSSVEAISDDDKKTYIANHGAFGAGLSKDELTKYYDRWAHAEDDDYDSTKFSSVEAISDDDKKTYIANHGAFGAGLSKDELTKYYDRWAHAEDDDYDSGSVDLGIVSIPYIGNPSRIHKKWMIGSIRSRSPFPTIELVAINNRVAAFLWLELCNASRYTGPEQTVIRVLNYFTETQRPTARVLDVAAGTGRIGTYLHNQGFVNIDALDPSEGMLKKAKARGAYTNLIQDFIGGDYKVPVQDGGLICLATRAEYLTNQPEYLSTIEQLKANNKWKLISTEYIDNYFCGKTGCVYKFVVL